MSGRCMPLVFHGREVFLFEDFPHPLAGYVPGSRCSGAHEGKVDASFLALADRRRGSRNQDPRSFGKLRTRIEHDHAVLNTSECCHIRIIAPGGGGFKTSAEA